MASRSKIWVTFWLLISYIRENIFLIILCHKFTLKISSNHLHYNYYLEMNLWLTLLRMISGAKYSGVPHNVHVLPFTRFAKPKSVIWNSSQQQAKYQQAWQNSKSHKWKIDINPQHILILINVVPKSFELSDQSNSLVTIWFRSHCM